MGDLEWGMLLGLSVLWGGSYFFYAVLTAALPPLTVVLVGVGLVAIVLHLGMLNNVIPSYSSRSA